MYVSWNPQGCPEVWHQVSSSLGMARIQRCNSTKWSMCCNICICALAHLHATPYLLKRDRVWHAGKCGALPITHMHRSPATGLHCFCLQRCCWCSINRPLLLLEQMAAAADLGLAREVDCIAAQCCPDAVLWLLLGRAFNTCIVCTTGMIIK